MSACGAGYTGEGGQDTQRRQNHNQKLKCTKSMSGNQGLAMNCAAKIPVRVIRKQEHDSYVYDGLYQVTEWKRVASQDGPVVLKYKMVRLSTETGEPLFRPSYRLAPRVLLPGESSSLPLMCCSCGILGCCPLGNVEERLLLSTGTVSKSVKFRTSKFKGQLLAGARVHGHGGDVVRAQQRRR